MSSPKTHGQVDHGHLDRRTDYLYRISIKALIINDAGEVLVVKENGRDTWDLPGGGMDHGEDFRSAIARELHEEISLSGEFDFRIIAVEDPAHLSAHSFWQVRLIYSVAPRDMTFSPGPDADAVKFVVPSVFADSASATERKIYQYAQLYQPH